MHIFSSEDNFFFKLMQLIFFKFFSGSVNKLRTSSTVCTVLDSHEPVILGMCLFLFCVLIQ